VTEVYPVVQALCASEFALDLVCKLLSISRSAYYAWLRRVPSNREREDRELRPLVSQIFWENRRRYGTRRIVKALAAKSVKCSERRIARLMGEMDLQAIQPKSFRPRTTDSRHRLGYSPNLLPDIDEPTATDQLWVGDITYIPLQTARFAYAAFLMDRFSRRIIGWAIEEHMREALACLALDMALKNRQPHGGLVHHTDRGGQYAGKKYRRQLSRFQIQQSMSRPANCYDNAFMESCFGTLKSELEMERYPNIEIARSEIETYIRYYNTRRIHSSLDYVSPLDFEGRSSSTKKQRELSKS